MVCGSKFLDKRLSVVLKEVLIQTQVYLMACSMENKIINHNYSMHVKSSVVYVVYNLYWLDNHQGIFWVYNHGNMIHLL